MSNQKDPKDFLYEGERLDDLQRDGMYIIQNPKWFCFGMDAVLLSAYAKVKKGEHALPFFCLCKPGKQNGIHPKTEPFRILNDKIAVAMQFIKSLLFINQIIWHRQFWIFLPYLLMRKVPLIPAQSALHDLVCVLT